MIIFADSASISCCPSLFLSLSRKYRLEVLYRDILLIKVLRLFSLTGFLVNRYHSHLQFHAFHSAEHRHLYTCAFTTDPALEDVNPACTCTLKITRVVCSQINCGTTKSDNQTRRNCCESAHREWNIIVESPCKASEQHLWFREWSTISQKSGLGRVRMSSMTGERVVSGVDGYDVTSTHPRPRNDRARPSYQAPALKYIRDPVVLPEPFNIISPSPNALEA